MFYQKFVYSRHPLKYIHFISKKYIQIQIITAELREVHGKEAHSKRYKEKKL